MSLLLLLLCVRYQLILRFLSLPCKDLKVAEAFSPVVSRIRVTGRKSKGGMEGGKLCLGCSLRYFFAQISHQLSGLFQNKYSKVCPLKRSLAMKMWNYGTRTAAVFILFTFIWVISLTALFLGVDFRERRRSKPSWIYRTGPSSSSSCGSCLIQWTIHMFPILIFLMEHRWLLD